MQGLFLWWFKGANMERFLDGVSYAAVFNHLVANAA
jgi:hypothetical protein